MDPRAREAGREKRPRFLGSTSVVADRSGLALFLRKGPLLVEFSDTKAGGGVEGLEWLFELAISLVLEKSSLATGKTGMRGWWKATFTHPRQVISEGMN